MDRNGDENDVEFVRQLTAAQPALYACILALLPDRTAAQDVLQESNLTLWRKRASFEPGTSFIAWASRIARYHVLNQRRKMQRDRLVFDDDLFEELAARQAMRAEDAGRYADQLRDCLERLPQDQRELVAQRYALGGSVTKIAAARSKSVGSISQMLYRIRERLLNCLSLTWQEERLA